MNVTAVFLHTDRNTLTHRSLRHTHYSDRYAYGVMSAFSLCDECGEYKWQLILSIRIYEISLYTCIQCFFAWIPWFTFKWYYLVLLGDIFRFLVARLIISWMCYVFRKFSRQLPNKSARSNFHHKLQKTNFQSNGDSFRFLVVRCWNSPGHWHCCLWMAIFLCRACWKSVPRRNRHTRRWYCHLANSRREYWVFFSYALMNDVATLLDSWNFEKFGL